mgnify:CR=1 FL=1
MKILLITLSVIAAAFAQWGFSSWDIGGIPPPFIPAAVFFWFLRIKLPSRLWFAILIGFLFDSFRIFPFGTYLLVFFLESLLAESLHVFFSSLRSTLTQGAGLGIMLVLFFGLVPAVAILSAGLSGLTLAGILPYPSVTGMLLWTGIFTFVLTGALGLLRPAKG